jgi:transposase
MEPGKPYPSDVNRVQFELIRPLLEGVRKRTKPRTVDLYEVFNAVLYLLKSGCQWSILPERFPNWRTVHSYFAKWSAADQDGVSVLERALKKSVGEARAKLGRNAMTSFLIVDAQSVKNTDSAEQKGCDAGKKVSGIRRHIAVDTRGLPHAIAVTTAEVTARNGALAAIDRCKPNLERVESLLVNGGYTGEPWPTA